MARSERYEVGGKIEMNENCVEKLCVKWISQKLYLCGARLD